MTQRFSIHVFPAQRGDALWIEYGAGNAPQHLLIDGGIAATGRTHLLQRIEELGTPLHFELLVITHIDLDHIQGILAFLEELPDGVTFGDIWFNGWDQLKASGLEPMGIKEGIRLSEILKKTYSESWNKASGGEAIALRANGDVVSYRLEGGMGLTVLSPGHEQLNKLREEWDKVLESFGAAEEAGDGGAFADEQAHPLGELEPMGPVDVQALAEAKFTEDVTVPNGSSIALALEFGGRCALMLGDAYPTVVARSVQQLLTGSRLEVDAVKLAHHGSRNNTDRTLASMISAPTWIFSSNGANNTKHPHPEAVARVLHDGHGVETLVFNYRTDFNEMWDSADLKSEHCYQAVYGDGKRPVTVHLGLQ